MMSVTLPVLEEQLRRTVLSDLPREYFSEELVAVKRLVSLHRALAGCSDLAAMLESLSRWLDEYVEHVALGLVRNGEPLPLGLFQSGGAPNAKQNQMAAHWMAQAAGTKQGQLWCHSGYSMIFVPLQISGNWHRLVVVREGVFEGSERALLDELMEELSAPFHRTVGFEHVYDEARLDSLSGLANRRVFNEELRRIYNSALRYGHMAVLMCLDLDNFKQVNDTMGHAAGEQILRQVSRLMANTVRARDVVARAGGDEFSILLADSTRDAAERLVQRLVNGFTIIANGYTPVHGLGISIGFAEWRDGDTISQWWQRADESLYRAKSLVHPDRPYCA